MGIWNDTEGLMNGGTAGRWDTDINRPEPATLEEVSLSVSVSDKTKCFSAQAKKYRNINIYYSKGKEEEEPRQGR